MNTDKSKMSALRLRYFELSPEAFKSLRGVSIALENSSLGKQFVQLIYMRVSQINGCAYCLKMHGSALRAAGETPERMDSLAGWRVSPHFTDRERAALEWADSVTNISTTHAPIEAFEPLKSYFTDAEIADLTFAIITMNAFNRLAISMGQ